METIELLVSYFTISGDIYPGETEVSPFSFRERVEAAARAGFRGFGVHYLDVMHTAAKIGLPEMKRILDDNGMKYIELEFLIDWYEDGELRKKSDKTRYEIMKIAGELGLRDIKVGAGFRDTEPNIPRIQEEFAKLCGEAAVYGSDIVLEIILASEVRTIEAARAIVEGAAQANGGILVDIWHLARAGIDYSKISEIPPQYLRAVELDDADGEMVGTFWEDTNHHRRLCGEGVLNPPAFIREVQAAGYQGVYGVEILSADHRKQPLDVMAQRAFNTTMAQFKKL
jgi:sugar phosphate isomerase/epimerase